MEFFEKQGLHLKVERGSRVFPVDDKAASVLNVLKKVVTEFLKSRGVLNV